MAVAHPKWLQGVTVHDNQPARRTENIERLRAELRHAEDANRNAPDEEQRHDEAAHGDKEGIAIKHAIAQNFVRHVDHFIHLHASTDRLTGHSN